MLILQILDNINTITFGQFLGIKSKGAFFFLKHGKILYGLWVVKNESIFSMFEY
jgi:hypothetical protein